MSTERFEVGEVAIYHRPGSRVHGHEVTVLAGFQDRLCYDTLTGDTRVIAGYEISVPSWYGSPPYGGSWMAERHELRKRRPPQDWARLCDLNEIPSEELA